MQKSLAASRLCLPLVPLPRPNSDLHSQGDVLTQLQLPFSFSPSLQRRPIVSKAAPGPPCSLIAVAAWALAVRPCPVCPAGLPITPHIWYPGSHWPPLCPSTGNDMPLLPYNFCLYMCTLLMTHAKSVSIETCSTILVKREVRFFTIAVRDLEMSERQV